MSSLLSGDKSLVDALFAVAILWTIRNNPVPLVSMSTDVISAMKIRVNNSSADRYTSTHSSTISQCMYVAAMDCLIQLGRDTNTSIKYAHIYISYKALHGLPRNRIILLFFSPFK